MEIVRQAISNHPLFGSVKREIVVYDAHISTKFQQIVLEAEVEYFNAETNEKIENTFVSTLPNWVVNNNDFTTVRDSSGQPVANPKFREAPAEGEDDRTPEEREKYLKQPSFDYFLALIEKGVDLVALLRLHIIENDKIKYFDNEKK